MAERPCTTLASHRWTHGDNTFLSLADSAGWLDTFRCWRCLACGTEVWATGVLTSSAPPLSPVQWQTQATAQQAGGDLYGKVVQQQEAWERQQRGVHKRLKGGRR